MRGKTGIVCCTLLAIVLLTYSNHFHNSFHFDDSHSVVDNPYIRDLGNLKLIFTDAQAFSTLPANRSYRPIVTASLALDYWLGSGLNPFYFHLSTIIWFLVQLALMFALFLTVYDRQPPPRNANLWLAAFATLLYGVHPAIAETVNYVIQRGDIYSTLGVVAGVVLYARMPALRNAGLYLIPVALGLLAKPPALVFPALLFAYIRLVEDKSIRQAMIACLPALAVDLAVAGLITLRTPATYDPGAASALAYRITQPFVALNYFRSFFLPLHLSADTDRVAFASVADPGVWAGIAFIVILIGVALLLGRKPARRPAAFGLWWFLIALIPTSIFPLAEVENDHRMYFPFVGLVLAAGWIVGRIAFSSSRSALRTVSIAGMVLVLAACAAGTRARNEVWRTDESLWHDVTLKSPRNGRGWMNYGLTLMQRGDYSNALRCFEQALVFTPNYPTLEINLGVADGGLGRDADAERHFLRAIALAPNDSTGHYFYGRWLHEKNRAAEAAAQSAIAVAVNPDYLPGQYLSMDLEIEQGDWFRARDTADAVLRKFPSDSTAAAYRARVLAAIPAVPSTPEAFLNLSLALHRAGKYQESIQAAREAIKLRPDYAAAYNNIAAAYEVMHLWDDAIEAATQALKLQPEFQLARNNLAWAESQKRAGPKK